MLGTVPRRVRRFQLERIDDEVLLYDPESTRVLHLNEAASLIWGLCDGARSGREITELLVEAFPDSPDVRADVETTLRRYQDEGAIECDG